MLYVSYTLPPLYICSGKMSFMYTEVSLLNKMSRYDTRGKVK
jgi:hypothetical protein